MTYEGILIFSSIITVGIWICFYLILHANGQLKMLEHNQNKFGFIVALLTTIFFISVTEIFVLMISLAIFG